VNFWQNLADAEYATDSRSWREGVRAVLVAHPKLLDATGADLAGLSEEEHKRRAVLLLLKGILDASEASRWGARLRSFRDLAGG
jgi:hypothetical protein